MRSENGAFITPGQFHTHEATHQADQPDYPPSQPPDRLQHYSQHDHAQHEFSISHFRLAIPEFEPIEFVPLELFLHPSIHFRIRATATGTTFIASPLHCKVKGMLHEIATKPS